jgi:hypothetical protein
LRCTGRTLRSEPSPHLAGEAALPSQYFKERHRDRQCLPRLAVPPLFQRIMNETGSRLDKGAFPPPRLSRRSPPSGEGGCGGGPGRGVAQETVPVIDSAARNRAAAVKRAADFPLRALSGPPSSPINARTTGALLLLGAFRRGGRVVECTALEMRHRCKPIGGSNPSLSANIIRHNKTAYRKLGRSV